MRSSERTIRNVAKKIEEIGSIGDKIRCVHHRGVRPAENIVVVKDSVAEGA